MMSLFLYFAPKKASCKFADAAHSDRFQLLHSTYLSPAEQLGWVILATCKGHCLWYSKNNLCKLCLFGLCKYQTNVISDLLANTCYCRIVFDPKTPRWKEKWYELVGLSSFDPRSSFFDLQWRLSHCLLLKQLVIWTVVGGWHSQRDISNIRVVSNNTTLPSGPMIFVIPFWYFWEDYWLFAYL